MEVEQINAGIGSKIKDLRLRNGLTQQELADRAELTKGFISQLERGQVTPSLVSLLDLIEILGSSPSEFFKETTEEQVVFGPREYFNNIDEKRNQRTWIIPNAQKHMMEPLIVEIAPGQSLDLDDPHEGEEFGYVLEGEAEIYLGEQVYRAQAGESFYYVASKGHYLANRTLKITKLLWISTPPSF